MVVGDAGRAGMEVGGVRRGTGRIDTTGFQLVYQNGCQTTSTKMQLFVREDGRWCG